MKIIIFLLATLLNFSIFSQSPASLALQDSLLEALDSDITQEERIDAKNRYIKEIRYSNPSLGLKLAKENYNITINEDITFDRDKTIVTLAALYLINAKPDSTKWLYNRHIRHFLDENKFTEANSLTQNMSSAFIIQNNLDSALYYIDQGLVLIQKTNEIDSSKFAANLYSKGFILANKGYYQLALENYITSLKIYDQIGHDLNTPGVYHGIATAHMKLSEFEKSQEYAIIALEKATRDNSVNFKYPLLNLIAGNYIALDEFEKSKEIILQIYEIAKELKRDINLAISYDLLARVEFELGNNVEAVNWATKGDSVSRIINHEYLIGRSLRLRAMIAVSDGMLNKAKRLIQQAERYQKTYPDPTYTHGTFFEMAELYTEINDYENAYNSLNFARNYNDSVFTVEKNIRFDELNLKYETDLKDASISLLNKEAELDQSRKKALSWGLILLALFASGIIYGQVQRRKRVQEKAERDQEIEIEKRKNAEQQLEFKKKELLAKVLQLSKKNEFLHSLEQEVNQLKSTVGGSIAKSTSRIDRMITNDAIDEEEWNQFSKEFSSVHEGFIQKITQRYGTFSQSEIRLISLLKMNLSSKEIANILRISDEGIKKARYRLRKKMGLETGDDLQGMIVGL